VVSATSRAGSRRLRKSAIGSNLALRASVALDLTDAMYFVKYDDGGSESLGSRQPYSLRGIPLALS
jgi:hypothetical protein